MKEPIIITGAAGSIGRNIVAALNACGVTDLVLVDRLGTDDRWRNLHCHQEPLVPSTTRFASRRQASSPQNEVRGRPPERR